MIPTHRARRHGLGLLLALAWPALVGNPAAATPSLSSAESTRLLSANDPEAADVDEARRRGLWTGPDPATAGSAWTTLDAAARGLDPRFISWWTPAESQGLELILRPEIETLGRASDPHRQLDPLHLGVGSGEAVDPAWRVRVGARADLRMLTSPDFSAHLRFTFDSEGQNDPRNRTRDFGQLDASNNFDEAYVRWSGHRAALLFGRMPLRWGPERLGGLLLDDAAPAPDLALGALRWGPHFLQVFAGQLSFEPVADGSDPPLRRWIYGHRADLSFLEDRLRVGLAELAVVAGQSESLNLRFLNPVSLWAQTQVEEDGNDATQVNVFNSVDAELRPKQGLRIYGTFLVDDLQIDDLGRRRNPDQLAWSTGTDWTPTPSSPWLLGYEYRRLGSWTFLHRGAGTDLQQYERPLGAPEGPDFDRHSFRIDWRVDPALLFWLEGERRRRGENRLSTEVSRAGSSGRPFPLGIVEKRWVAAAGLAWSFSVPRPGPFMGKAALQAAFHDIYDADNELGRDEKIWELRFSLTLRAPGLRYRP